MRSCTSKGMVGSRCAFWTWGDFFFWGRGLWLGSVSLVTFAFLPGGGPRLVAGKAYLRFLSLAMSVCFGRGDGVVDRVFTAAFLFSLREESREFIYLE